MKTKSIIGNLSFLTLLAVSASLTPSLASAEGGYNGPDLAGKSIPVAVDRAITPEDALKATQLCAEATTRQIFMQVFRTEMNDVKVDVVFNETSGSVGVALQKFSSRTSPFSGHYFSKSESASFELFHVAELNSSSLSLHAYWHTDSNYSDKKLAKYGLNKENKIVDLMVGMPFFKYTKQDVQPASYDELGQPIYSGPATVVKDLTIELPAQYGTATEMRNTDSKHTTAITVNQVDYVNCLQAKLQK